MLKKEYKTLLSGRNITKRIDTLSFREYLQFKNVTHCDLPASSETENQLIRHFEDYLHFNATGRMLENVIYTQLRRQPNEIYFHKQKKESTITDAIQVCYALDDKKTKAREVSGLIDALDYFNLNTGLIVTMYKEDILEISHQSKTYHITILPAWKWLLQK